MLLPPIVVPAAMVGACSSITLLLYLASVQAECARSHFIAVKTDVIPCVRVCRHACVWLCVWRPRYHDKLCVTPQKCIIYTVFLQQNGCVCLVPVDNVYSVLVFFARFVFKKFCLYLEICWRDCVCPGVYTAGCPRRNYQTHQCCYVYSVYLQLFKQLARGSTILLMSIKTWLFGAYTVWLTCIEQASYNYECVKLFLDICQRNLMWL